MPGILLPELMGRFAFDRPGLAAISLPDAAAVTAIGNDYSYDEVFARQVLAVREGSAVQISLWDTDEHATQLDHLTEMTVRARGEAEAVGVTFTPIVNYPLGWTI